MSWINLIAKLKELRAIFAAWEVAKIPAALRTVKAIAADFLGADSPEVAILEDIARLFEKWVPSPAPVLMADGDLAELDAAISKLELAAVPEGALGNPAILIPVLVQVGLFLLKRWLDSRKAE